MRTLRFTKHHPPYNPGEIAGFENRTAEKILARGVAEDVTPKPEPEPTRDSPGGYRTTRRSTYRDKQARAEREE